MNKIQKAIVSMLVIAIMAFSTGTLLNTAKGTSLPWFSTQLVTSGQLTVAGSSTVGPIASEEINSQEGNFVGYWNNLVNTGAVTSSTISQVNLATLGSGTAIPALQAGTADVGEMSRPPQDAEFGDLNDMQQYAVGVDSVAIVLSPDMTWFPHDLTTLQVANLFVDTNPTGTTNQPGSTTTGATGSTPLYATWGDFLTAYYAPSAVPSTINGVAITSAILNEPIQRAVRDPTSGTFDCFNNYFAVPNGYQFEYKTSGTVTASSELAPFTYCEENINIYNAVSGGSLTTNNDYIGFISLGYLETYGVQNGVTHMLGLDIAFNTAQVPKSYIAEISPGTIGDPTPDWSAYVAPTTANVIYAYSGIAGSAATGQYEAWRWLWEVVPGPIQSTGPTLVAGVWIAYMMADGTTNAGEVATTPGTGTSSFVLDNNYIQMERDDMAGGPVLDSNLQPYTTLPTQTQSYPTGVVNFNDITYFVAAYINYQVNGIYNPYADMNAKGVINFNDISLFVGNYIAYYTTWNPP